MEDKFYELTFEEVKEELEFWGLEEPTDKEMEVAQEMFGNTIDYSTIISIIANELNNERIQD